MTAPPYLLITVASAWAHTLLGWGYFPPATFKMKSRSELRPIMPHDSPARTKGPRDGHGEQGVKNNNCVRPTKHDIDFCIG